MDINENNQKEKMNKNIFKNKTFIILILLIFAVTGLSQMYNFQYKKGDMNLERVGHTATLLKDGRVLIIGGAHGGSPDKTAEIYDPKSNIFKIIGKTKKNYYNGSRFKDKSLLLKDGRVILISTFDNNGRIEIYDPKKNQFNLSKDEMHFYRFNNFSATLLGNGRVLIAGGEKRTGETLSSAEIYDPVKDKFNITGNMNIPRNNHSAVLLPNGKVLIFGGSSLTSNNNWKKYKSIEIYDPNNGKFTLEGNLLNQNLPIEAIMIKNDKVLIVSDSPELYDYRTQRSKYVAKLVIPRTFAESVLLNNGEVLIIGGIKRNQALSTVEIYNPKTNKFVLLKNMKLPRVNHTATLLNNGNIVITGGSSWFIPPHKVYKQTEIYKP